MRKWDEKLTLTLQARLYELQGKTLSKEASFMKIVASVSNGLFSKTEKMVLSPSLKSRILKHIHKK